MERMANLEIDGSTGEEHAHEGKQGEMLLPGVYTVKIKQWGAWILAQWATCGILDITDLNSIGAEAAALKRRHACSIPNSIAIDFLADIGPLVEIGAGGGLWARRLAKRDVDIVAYDTPNFDEDYQDGGTVHTHASKLTEVNWFDGMKRGDPSRATEHADRALLLSWPDISGGVRPHRAPELHRGTVVTIGEWHDQTFGGRPSATVSGMSFSRFSWRKPSSPRNRPAANWPMFDAALIHWKRNPRDRRSS